MVYILFHKQRLEKPQENVRKMLGQIECFHLIITPQQLKCSFYFRESEKRRKRFRLLEISEICEQSLVGIQSICKKADTIPHLYTLHVYTFHQQQLSFHKVWFHSTGNQYLLWRSLVSVSCGLSSHTCLHNWQL